MIFSAGLASITRNLGGRDHRILGADHGVTSHLTLPLLIPPHVLDEEIITTLSSSPSKGRSVTGFSSGAFV